MTKGSAFTNQKQLRVSRNSQIQIQQLAGDLSTDNRIDLNDAENNLTARAAMFQGEIFMHPMHDATADPQLAANDKPKHRRWMK